MDVNASNAASGPWVQPGDRARFSGGHLDPLGDELLEPECLTVVWDSFVLTLEEEDIEATSYSSRNYGADPRATIDAHRAGARTADPSSPQREGVGRHAFFASTPPACKHARADWPTMSSSTTACQGCLIEEALIRCKRLHARLALFEKPGSGVGTLPASLNAVSTPSKSTKPQRISSPMAGVHPLARTGARPCWNGPKCMFLVGGVCQYYHPPEHLATAAEGPSPDTVGQRWNVLVNSAARSAQDAGKSKRDATSESRRSRSPRR